MSKTHSIQSLEEAIALVQGRLDAHQPKDFKLQVVPEASRRDDDWWYVCVKPDRSGFRAFDYYKVLSEIEREIEDEDEVNVLLVPVQAGD